MPQPLICLPLGHILFALGSSRNEVGIKTSPEFRHIIAHSHLTLHQKATHKRPDLGIYKHKISIGKNDSAGCGRMASLETYEDVIYIIS